MFDENVTPILSNSDKNTIQVENFQEIFFGVYEIDINESKYQVEKISEYEGNPVVAIPITVKGETRNFPFVLLKGSQKIEFNENNLEIGIVVEDTQTEKVEEEHDDIPEVVFTEIEIEEESSFANVDKVLEEISGITDGVRGKFIMFEKVVEPIFTPSSQNILKIEKFEEIFYNVFEITLNDKVFVAEKISEYEGNPVVSIPIELDNVRKTYPFVLVRGEQEIIFNENNQEIEILPEPIVEEVEEDRSEFRVVVEEYIDEPTKHIDTNKILEEINEAKDRAKKQASVFKRKKIEEINKEIKDKKRALREMVENERSVLINEFVKVSTKIKQDLIRENNYLKDLLNEKLNEEIEKISDDLGQSLKKDFTQHSEKFDRHIKKLTESYKKIIESKIGSEIENKIDDGIHNLSEKVDNKLKEIEESLDGRLSDLPDKEIIESVIKSNVELNDKVNRGVNKALSKVGNLDKKVDEKISNIEENLNEVTSKVESRVDEKLQNVEDEISSFHQKNKGLEEKHETLDRKINESVSDLSDKIDVSVSLIDEKVEGSISDLDEKFEKTTADIKSDIKNNLLSIEEKIHKFHQERLDILDSVVESNVELHDILNKKVNEVFDGIDNLDKKLKETVTNIGESVEILTSEIENEFDGKISELEKKLTTYYEETQEIDEKVDKNFSTLEEKIERYHQEKIQLLEEKSEELNDSTREYLINLLNESKDELFKEIRDRTQRDPIEYIINTDENKEQKTDFDKIIKDLDKKIHDKFENYKVELRKYVSQHSGGSSSGGGGGTVAVQYADGGTMNGNLTVVGTISASQYLGIPSSGGGFSGDYLPLSGGTIDGKLTVTEEISSSKTAYFPHIQFDTTAAQLPISAGLLQWNATDGTLDLGMGGGEVTQQIGQELFVKVRNDTGITIPNATPVYITGRQGNRTTIAPAKSDQDSTSRVFGVTTQDLHDNDDGFITTFGYVRQIKTNYIGSGNWGTTWVGGDYLYVSKDVAGQLTNIEPIAPHHSDIIGIVGNIGNVGVGSIFVSIKHHNALSELSDVNGTPLTTSGQLLVWDQDNQYFDFTNNINDYLPLTGGTIDGNLTVVGTISASRYLGVSAGAVSDHDTLNNLQGGQVGEYYHLTQQQNLGLSWMNLATSWTLEPTLNATLSSGEVYEYTYGPTIYYRFVPNPYNSTQDSFYGAFNGSILSNLIISRGNPI